MFDDTRDSTIVRELARYLQANPRACDTAEGIHRWWLSPDTECTHDSVVFALDWMARHDLIEMTTAADGRQRFARRGTGEQLEAFLRSSADDQVLH